MDTTVQERPVAAAPWKTIAGHGVRRLRPIDGQSLDDVFQLGLNRGFRYCPAVVAEQLPGVTSTQPGYVICRTVDGTVLQAFLVCGTGMILPAKTRIKAILDSGNWSVLMADPVA